MDNPKIAIAAFVKTPEISPVKTRLAQTIGHTQARAIYEESVKQTALTLQTAIDSIDHLHAYWAVGEKEALSHERWQLFPTLWTGDNGLGNRLHHVYSTLLQTHQRVILVGTDCPQLPMQYIQQAITANDKIIIGPATDGGFYLLSGQKPIPATCWLNVKYSQDDTLSQLISTLTDPALSKTQNHLEFLPPLTDIDDIHSLQHCLSEWGDTPHKKDLQQLYNHALHHNA